MESLNLALFSRPASFRFFQICSQVLRPISKRHQSSYRRSRSRLNIKPDASFLPSKTETQDHIIFNPPPSAPNVYHTPTIFLPQSDPRQRSHASLAALNTRVSPQKMETNISPPDLPPAVRKPYEKRYHLDEKDLEEMRALRREDPVKWSRTQLAKKFDCSNIFVAFVTEGLAKEQQKRQREVTEVVKSRWGIKRRVAREDRAIRKEKWSRDA